MNPFLLTAFAEGEAAATGTAAAGAAAGGPMAMLSTLLLPILMIVILYFILIRPQRKRDKLTKEMLAGLIVGDKIITIGGIYGKITGIKDDTLILEVGNGAEKSTLKIGRWAVREVEKPAEA